ncbi:two-component regulator propeller domain-containing protein [Flavobacterium granuli]|uniref:histidine kinase n=1 Tax=Flavobacterium granuli TaxID=280093 RepID=A0ABU1S4M0_9FLAO|nr:two-component regulator propeller domain-containing protein [Flavobacterium granuli]MDR6845984.1 signal transduction histidine kinase/ligand-binding sensor domain-containing protein [Flavobacterium granuli]
MKKCFFVILLVSFQVFYSSVSAQLNPSNFTAYPELGGTLISDIITDRQGIVWIATSNGLVQYDGYDYKHFDVDPNDAQKMGSILTQKLFEAKDGHIWIGCTDIISEYNPVTRTFKNYNFLKLTDFSLGSRPLVTTINEDTRGRIYFGTDSFIGYTASHALFYKDENSNTLKRFDSPNNEEIKNVYSVATDHLDNVWVIAANGFFMIDKNKNTQKMKWPIAKFLSSQYHTTIKCDVNGNVWMSSSSEVHSVLSVWNPNTGKVKSYPFKESFTKNNAFFITEMEFDAKGNIWLGTTHGLMYFDLKKEEFEVLNEDQNQKMTRNALTCLHLDSFDNLWIGTEVQGLLRYTNRVVFKSYVYKKEDKNSITQGWLSKVFENGVGKIWITTDAGLNVFDPVNNTLTPYPISKVLSGLTFFYGIGLYSPEEIFFLTNLGYFVFNTNSKTCKKVILDPRLEKTFIQNLVNDSKGNQWYCTAKGAFLKTKNKETLRHFDLTKISGSNLSSNEVTNIYDSPKHGVWLLTNNGLFLYNYGTDKVIRYAFDKKKGDVLKSQDINSFYEDKEGVVWVGTWGGGLSKCNIKTGKIITYTMKEGLPSMGIQGILPDEKNKALWLSTFDGISRFSIVEGRFNNFSMEEGIQGRLFADGVYLKTSKGLMFFGGKNGITLFNPDNISKNSAPPKVFITDFKIGDNSIYFGTDSIQKYKKTIPKDFILKYNQNSISINYTGIHYANPNRNKFTYRLENYDNNWREVGNIRTAYYYDLPPGNYIFRVKAANSSGVWNKIGASVAFSITPPWWRTWWAYTLYGVFFLLVVFLIDRFQRKRLLEKEHALTKEKELVHAREIEKAYNTLKTTQLQLIQSEKMASLGELTAGIAHEIQNPLNFVNNFSEVSLELMDEMHDEMEKGDTKEAKAISIDIKQNLEKIIFHGKRADGIVKGMLQHSRISSGQKELTDINTLADEYLRLAYHGLRAKDKSFNAELETHFDAKLPKIDVVPQDIGRVLLNLFTNAFYSTHQKQKTAAQEYKPVLCVSTAQKGNFIEITAKDNGTGIPNAIKNKIMQPFFTTKPAGEGTGLGLSLSYDIVVKGHGGTINVETEEGNGATFIITLPI